MTDKLIRFKVFGRRVRLLRPYPRKLIDSLTSFSIPNAYFMPLSQQTKRVIKVIGGKRVEVQEKVWDGKKHYLKNRRLPLGLFIAISKELKAQGYKFRMVKRVPVRKVEPYTFHTQKWNIDKLYYENYFQRCFPTARRYQYEAAAMMALYSRCGGLVIQATGSGKTFLAGMFLGRAHLRVKSLFVVDELSGLHQAQKEIQRVAGEPVGIVGEGIFKPRRITVATTQTLSRYKKKAAFKSWFEEISLVIVDEIHVQMSRRSFKIMEGVKPLAVYGLTATLQLKKKEVRTNAYALAGPVIYEYPIEQGVREKFLTQAIVVKVPFEGRTDWDEEEYSVAYKKGIVVRGKRNKLIEDIIRLSLDNGRKVISLTERVKHLHILKKRMDDLEPVLVYGAVPSKERIEIKKRFEKGKLDFIMANKVFEKSVNIKVVDTGIDCSAMKSKNKAIQRVGRIVRLSEGKRYSLYFDVADSGNRFEKAWRQRRSAYRAQKIPIITWTPEQGWDALEEKVEAVLRKLQRRRKGDSA